MNITEEFMLRYPEKLGWLILVLPFAGLLIYQLRKRTADLHEFLPSKPEHAKIGLKQKIRMSLMTISFALFVFSFSRPANNPHPESLLKKGRDLTFILDVSHSMLAEDLAPNRLKRAKMYIQDCVKSLENHRIALVVFAGSASIKCPLTTDKEFFLETLEHCGPGSVSQGGTRFSDAILKTCDKIFGKENNSQNIILISDGGNQSTKLENEIDLINKKKIRLFCIGLGDSINGSRIPNPENMTEFLKKDGQEIWTKLETEKMKELVKACKGAVYIPAGTRSLKLDEAYRDLQSMNAGLQTSDHENIVYDDIFHHFLLAGLILLFISLLISDRQTIRKTVTGLFIILFTCSFDNAELAKMTEEAEKNPTTENYFELANNCFEDQNYNFALNFYNRALELTNDKSQRVTISYNLALTLTYIAQSKEIETPQERLGLLDQSLGLYRLVAKSNPNYRQNLVLAVKARQKVVNAILKDADNQKLLQQAIAVMKKQLEKALAAQIEALKKVAEKGNAEQLMTNKLTDESKVMLEKYIKNFKDFDQGSGLMTFVKMFVENAILAQKELKKLDDASKRLQYATRSRGEIANALSALSSDQQAQSNSEDSKETESDEEGDEEESDESSDNMEMDDSENSQLEDSMEQQNLLPKDSVEDLIKREKELQKSRSDNSKKNGGKNSKEGVTW